MLPQCKRLFAVPTKFKFLVRQMEVEFLTDQDYIPLMTTTIYQLKKQQRQYVKVWRENRRSISPQILNFERSIAYKVL